MAKGLYISRTKILWCFQDRVVSCASEISTVRVEIGLHIVSQMSGFLDIYPIDLIGLIFCYWDGTLGLQPTIRFFHLRFCSVWVSLNPEPKSFYALFTHPSFWASPQHTLGRMCPCLVHLSEPAVTHHFVRPNERDIEKCLILKTNPPLFT